MKLLSKTQHHLCIPNQVVKPNADDVQKVAGFHFDYNEKKLKNLLSDIYLFSIYFVIKFTKYVCTDGDG